MPEPTPYQRFAYEYARDRIGRPTRTLSWASGDDAVAIPIAEVVGSPQPGLTSYFTIGLGEYDTDQESGDGTPIRVEFVMVARDGEDTARAGLGNCALNVASGDFAVAPGGIYPDIFGLQGEDLSVPFGLLWLPSSWEDDLDGKERDGVRVEWLQVIPITAAERKWAIQHGAGFDGEGVRRLLELFGLQDVDIYNFRRSSASLPQ